MVVRENQLSPSIYQDHYLNLSFPPFHMVNILPLHVVGLHLSILLAFLLRPISLTSLIFAPNMSQDISKSSSHSPSPALSTAKAVAKYIRTHPLYISYLIFFSPYILKLLSFLSPLILILLLATALCAFSNTASSSHSFSLLGNKTQENGASTTHLEAEAYKIIFETFHDSVTSLADDCEEIEAYKQMIKIENLVPEIVKSCCSSTPLQDPPLHEIVAKATIISDDDELPCSETAKNTNCNETEIIKHMVCSTFNKPDVMEREEDEIVKAAVGVEINKAERPLFILTTTTTTPQKRESNEAIVNINQSPNSTDLHKTSRSFSLPSVESMRREKEWTRTLACKLFEERHNSGSRGGEDGMDMLWETYESIESESPPMAADQRRTMSRRSRRAMTMESEDRAFRVYADEHEEGDDDVAAEEDDVASGKMCCLQALKMSSGKVNLGIGRKNMMKFSKALKRFGWLHKTTNSNQNAKTRK